MSDQRLPAVELAPKGEHRASIIWLHGLGADGHDFVPVVPELGVDDLGIRFVFPHAPTRAVTINGGMAMPAWYDIASVDLDRHVDTEDLDEARVQLGAWIDHERSLGIPSDKILIAGFSQGGAVALYTGLDHPERLAGIAALSTYHPVPERIGNGHEANAQTSVFMAHGTHDPVVPMSLAEATAKRLEAANYPLEWHTYPMPHSVSPDEIRDLSAWLQKRIP